MMDGTSSEPEGGSILQLKVRLLRLGPMVWRRVLVPEVMSLRELHGVLQVAMGWDGIHLFEFSIRGVRYSSPNFCGAPPRGKHCLFSANSRGQSPERGSGFFLLGAASEAHDR